MSIRMSFRPWAVTARKSALRLKDVVIRNVLKDLVYSKSLHDPDRLAQLHATAQGSFNWVSTVFVDIRLQVKRAI